MSKDLSAVMIGLLLTSCMVRAAELKFTFGDVQPGFTQALPETGYDAQRGYGFLPAADGSSLVRTFAVNVEEGNYDVTIRFAMRPSRRRPQSRPRLDD